MSLVVLGGQGLDELEQWVSDLFSAVPSGKGDRPTFFEAGMPYKVGFCLLLLSSSQLLPHHITESKRGSQPHLATSSKHDFCRPTVLLTGCLSWLPSRQGVSWVPLGLLRGT